jgi:cysteine desulfurase
VQRIYLDHNATTPLAPEVADRMTAALRDEFGNPSSVHHFGQRAKAAIDEARSAVAALIGADPSEIIFTSGGTESDNLAIRGVAEALEPTGRRHLVTTTVEHEAVLNTFKALARRGWTTTLVAVDQSGIVAPDAVNGARCSRSPTSRDSRKRAAPSSTPMPCSRPARSRWT